MQGPQISETQRQKVLGLIQLRHRLGRPTGHRRRRPGEPARRATTPSPRCSPTSTPTSQVAQEEIFGPVLTVTPYDTDDEAVAIANNSIYGLSGEVSGADVDRALGGGQADAHRQRHHQRQEPLRHHQPVRRHQAERPGLPQRRRGLQGVPGGKTIGMPDTAAPRIRPQRRRRRSPRCCTATPAPSTPRTGSCTARCSPTTRTSTTPQRARSRGSRDEVVDWFAANFGADPDEHALHHQHRDATCDGDTATVRAMFYNPMQLPGMAELSYLRRLLPPRTRPHPRRVAQPSTCARRTCGSSTNRRAPGS